MRQPRANIIPMQAPLRIALVRQRYRPDGGAERFLSQALQALAKGEIELSVLARDWQRIDGVRFIACDPAKGLTRRHREKHFAAKARQLLAKHHFDLVQSHERIDGCDIYRAGDGVHAVWLQQRKRVLPAWRRASISISPYHHYVCQAERQLFENPRLRAVICNSNMVKQQIVERFEIAADKLHVIYNGVDIERFSPHNKQAQRTELRHMLAIPDNIATAAFVGSGFQRKGLSVVLKSIAAGSENCHLLVVGTDKRLQSYRRLANDLGLTERVHWLGVQQDVAPYYSAADYFFLPSLYDPFPNVVFEALASGLPVITSQQCGAAEILTDGVNGFVCDALDSAGFTQAVGQYDQLQACREQGEAARTLALRYRHEDMVQSLLSLYQMLLDGAYATS